MGKRSREIKLIIKGTIPSKKNSKRIICKGSSPLLLPSIKHEEWHEEQSYMIAKFRPKEPIEKCSILIVFYPKTRGIADSTNKAESIHDLLVDNRFIVDDNWFLLDDTRQRLGGVDKNNPRAEVYIKYE